MTRYVVRCGTDDKPQWLKLNVMRNWPHKFAPTEERCIAHEFDDPAEAQAVADEWPSETPDWRIEAVN